MAHLALQITMSSQLTSLTTVFNGQDYNNWSKAMRAFLMAQGLWGYASGNLSEPFKPTEPEAPKPLKSLPSDEEKEKYERYYAYYKNEKAAYDRDLPTFPERKAAWVKANDMTLGTITLRLSPALQQRLPHNQNAEELWDWLKNQFATPSIPTCYRDLKEAISIRFNPAKHPGPQIDRMIAAFNRISQTVTARSITVDLTINTVLQGLIAMAAIPPKWENLVSILCANNELAELDIDTVREAVVTQYENETNRGGHKGAQNAQKLSAVKQKRGNPRFSQQERPQQPQARPSNPNQQQSFRQRGSRGNKGRGGKPNKARSEPIIRTSPQLQLLLHQSLPRMWHSHLHPPLPSPHSGLAALRCRGLFISRHLHRGLMGFTPPSIKRSRFWSAWMSVRQSSAPRHLKSAFIR